MSKIKAEIAISVTKKCLIFLKCKSHKQIFIHVSLIIIH